MSFKLGIILGILIFVILSIVLSVLGTFVKIIFVILALNLFIWFRFFGPFCKNERKR